jgi:hypothetical protein
VTLTSCAGGLTDISGDDKYMVNLGFAVFGDQGESFMLPCTAKGIVDCGCVFSPSVSHECCCHETTFEDLWCTTGRACTYGGGKAIQVSCSKRCDEVCANVATVPETWGRIKSRHD